jgi:hypothetical protein
VLETDKTAAINALKDLIKRISQPNKSMKLEAVFGNQNSDNIILESNFERELAYNLEHAIHHMALIRIGLNELTDIVVSNSFGVAASTLKYRTECVQ